MPELVSKSTILDTPIGQQKHCFDTTAKYFNLLINAILILTKLND